MEPIRLGSLWFVPGSRTKSPSSAMALDLLVTLLISAPVYFAALPLMNTGDVGGHPSTFSTSLPPNCPCRGPALRRSMAVRASGCAPA